MRFSHFLKYNAVPEWQNHYMDYNELKNLIYTLQTDELKLNDTTNVENGGTNSKKFFNKKLTSSFFVKNTKEPSSSKSGSASNEEHEHEADDVIQEQTYELEDFNNKNITNTEAPKTKKSSKSNSFKKVKEKLFDSSRRSSQSSEGRTLFNTYDAFLANLVQEKSKVDDFYKRLESKFYEKFETLIKDFEKEGINNVFIQFPQQTQSMTLDSNFSIGPDSNTDAFSQQQEQHLHHPNSIINSSSQKQEYDFKTITNDIYSEEDFDEEEDDYEAQDNTALLNYSQFNVKSQKKSLLKQSTINLYIDLCQLKSFIELNKMGFTKITKKADKVLSLNIREELIVSEEFYKDTYVFLHGTLAELNLRISQLVEFYAVIIGNSANLDECKLELKQFLHDHIVWERSNSWKDMLGLSSHTNDLENDDEKKQDTSHLNLDYYRYPLPYPIRIPRINVNAENIAIPKLFFTMKAFKIGFIFVVTAVLLGIKTFNDPAQHRCMALVECVAFSWASEALPLFVTAFLVPFLTVLFRVLKDDNGIVVGAASASSVILSTMWSSTIMILLAGFTLSSALAKYDIAKVLASWLLAFAGDKPRNVLIMSMAVVFFLSMWISNVASPVLTYSLMSPLLDKLDADEPFAKAMVLAIALSANIGGMSSPISSPQNIICMQYLKPYGIGWGQFFAVALPTDILAVTCVWGLMCVTFKINKTKIERFVPIRTKFTIKQYYVIFVVLGTIILWCVEAQIEGAFGSSGIIAVLPIALFFGTGLLTTQDLNDFPWSIVILAMGGIALGKAVSSSGLLATIAHALERRIEHDSTLAVLCIFGVLMLVVGTFVSHTVSAIIIVPLVQQVGNQLSSPKAAPILVFGCTLMSSAGMGLASSGFPNITAASTLDKKGKRYLEGPTFISRGVPASLIVFVCIITLGFGIMSSILKPAVAT